MERATNLVSTVLAEASARQSVVLRSPAGLLCLLRIRLSAQQTAKARLSKRVDVHGDGGQSLVQRKPRTVQWDDQCVQGLNVGGRIRVSVHPLDRESFLGGVSSKVLVRAAVPLHD